MASGFTALKTNPLCPAEAGHFARPTDGNLERGDLAIIVRQIETMREAVGPDIDICLDLNFRYRPRRRHPDRRRPGSLRTLLDRVRQLRPRGAAHVRRSMRTPSVQPRT